MRLSVGTIKRQYRIWRAELGLTQDKVAQRASLHRRTYWEIENGYRIPNEDEQKALAKVFKLTPDEFREKVAA